MNNNAQSSLLKRFAPAGLLLVIIIVIWLSGLADIIKLESIQENRQRLADLTAENPWAAAGLFTAVYAACVALSLPVASVLTLLGGFLFGTIFGTALVVAGATTGAAIIFLIARSAAGTALQDKAGPFFQKMASGLHENAASYLLFMRLVPLFPFWLVNIVPAMAGIRLRLFITTTFFGIIPGSFVYVNLGTALSDISALSDLASPKTLLAMTLLGLFALLPILYKRLKRIKST